MDANLSAMAQLNAHAGDELLNLHPSQLYAEDQDRKDWDSADAQEELQEMADNIKANNNTIAQPIVIVHGHDGKYLIKAGERRWRAATMLDLDVVPCLLKKHLDDISSSFLMLSENVIRRDLNPMEFAYAIKDRMERFGMDAREVAERVGLPDARIYKALKLLELPTILQGLALEGFLTDVRKLAPMARLPAEELEARDRLLRAGTLLAKDAANLRLVFAESAPEGGEEGEEPKERKLRISEGVAFLIYERQTRKKLNPEDPDAWKTVVEYFTKLEAKCGGEEE